MENNTEKARTIDGATVTYNTTNKTESMTEPKTAVSCCTNEKPCCIYISA